MVLIRVMLAYITWDTQSSQSNKNNSLSVVVAVNCLTLWYPMDCSPLGSSPWDFPGKIRKSRTRLSNFSFTFHFHALERKWQPTPVFLPGESQGWGSLVGCRLWGHTESDRLKRLSSSSSSNIEFQCQILVIDFLVRSFRSAVARKVQAYCSVFSKYDPQKITWEFVRFAEYKLGGWGSDIWILTSLPSNYEAP